MRGAGSSPARARPRPHAPAAPPRRTRAPRAPPAPALGYRADSPRCDRCQGCPHPVETPLRGARSRSGALTGNAGGRAARPRPARRAPPGPPDQPWPSAPARALPAPGPGASRAVDGARAAPARACASSARRGAGPPRREPPPGHRWEHRDRGASGCAKGRQPPGSVPRRRGFGRSRRRLMSHFVPPHECMGRSSEKTPHSVNVAPSRRGEPSASVLAWRSSSEAARAS